jgi:hypothetical protein
MVIAAYRLWLLGDLVAGRLVISRVLAEVARRLQVADAYRCDIRPPDGEI